MDKTRAITNRGFTEIIQEAKANHIITATKLQAVKISHGLRPI